MGVDQTGYHELKGKSSPLGEQVLAVISRSTTRAFGNLRSSW